jgi:hypothetical protein
MYASCHRGKFRQEENPAMIDSAASVVRLACVPGAIPAEDRSEHFARANRLFLQLASERNELTNGYEFRFDASALAEVARFIENERKCCPFMTFDLQVSPAAGPLWLRMTGPEGARAVLDAELNLSRPCGCGS